MIWLLRFIVVMAAAGFGLLLGFGVVMLLYTIANPAASPQDFGGGILAIALGLPCGGLTGLLVGVLIAVRYVRPRIRDSAGQLPGALQTGIEVRKES
jgi:ribose/xylose/arabinose/galactoside ABC-type transport system permease subunit